MSLSRSTSERSWTWFDREIEEISSASQSSNSSISLSSIRPEHTVCSLDGFVINGESSDDMGRECTEYSNDLGYQTQSNYFEEYDNLDVDHIMDQARSTVSPVSDDDNTFSYDCTDYHKARKYSRDKTRTIEKTPVPRLVKTVTFNRLYFGSPGSSDHCDSDDEVFDVVFSFVLEIIVAAKTTARKYSTRTL